jgi:hypothetical protein
MPSPLLPFSYRGLHHHFSHPTLSLALALSFILTLTPLPSPPHPLTPSTPHPVPLSRWMGEPLVQRRLQSFRQKYCRSSIRRSRRLSQDGAEPREQRYHHHRLRVYQHPSHSGTCAERNRTNRNLRFYLRFYLPFYLLIYLLFSTSWRSWRFVSLFSSVLFFLYLLLHPFILSLPSPVSLSLLHHPPFFQPAPLLHSPHFVSPTPHIPSYPSYPPYPPHTPPPLFTYFRIQGEFLHTGAA